MAQFESVNLPQKSTIKSTSTNLCHCLVKLSKEQINYSPIQLIILNFKEVKMA